MDLDPALLTVAEGAFADDNRVMFVTADLNPDWPAKLPYDSVFMNADHMIDEFTWGAGRPPGPRSSSRSSSRCPGSAHRSR